MNVTWEYTFPFPYPVRRFPLPIEGLWPPVVGCSASAGLVQGASAWFDSSEESEERRRYVARCSNRSEAKW